MAVGFLISAASEVAEDKELVASMDDGDRNAC